MDQHILTSVNSLSCEEWDATYGKIYSGLIQAGAQTVMVGHIAQPAYQKAYNPDFPDKLVPATLSPELLKGLLRKKLGFNGLIVTDSTCMVGLAVQWKERRRCLMQLKPDVICSSLIKIWTKIIGIC